MSVIRRDGVYYVTVNYDLFYFRAAARALGIWLAQLSDDDVVVISLSTCVGDIGASDARWMFGFPTFMAMVELCPAKTILRIDSHIGGPLAWLYLLCTEIEMQPFGEVSIVPIYHTTESTYSQCLVPLARHLAAVGVAKGRLTEEEGLQLVKERKSVTLTADALVPRLVKPNTDDT
jgi:hypothetical protein